MELDYAIYDGLEMKKSLKMLKMYVDTLQCE